MRTCVVSMVVSHSQLSIRHVLHVAYWRMTMNGGNVFKKQLIWQVVANSETYSSPFFATALLLISWGCGWSLEFTFVMTFNMLSIPKIWFKILQRSKSLTMVFTSLMESFAIATSLSMIDQPCHFLRMIGLHFMETG